MIKHPSFHVVLDLVCETCVVDFACRGCPFEEAYESHATGLW